MGRRLRGDLKKLGESHSIFPELFGIWAAPSSFSLPDHHACLKKELVCRWARQSLGGAGRKEN